MIIKVILEIPYSSAQKLLEEFYTGSEESERFIEKFRIMGIENNTDSSQISFTPPQIFLCYTSKDEEKVENLYQNLLNEGFKPWMAKKDILPGEDWKNSVERAIKECDFFVACLSTNSIMRRSFLQKEIQDALEVWQERLKDDIYLIPARLDDCKVPETLRDFHWVNLFRDDGFSLLVKAINEGTNRLRLRDNIAYLTSDYVKT